MKALWNRFVSAVPLGVALLCIAAVAVGGWVWSFEEQSRRAEALGFTLPWLLPLVLDGLSLSLAGVAFAAALDGRPAVFARLSTAVAVLTSATSNAEAAWARSGGKVTTVVIAAVVPIAANLAFEVFLGELRRQVHRTRGLPAPVAVAGPRLIRLALSPIKTGREWRDYVLATTAIPTKPIVEASTAPVDSIPATTDEVPETQPVVAVTSQAVEPPLPKIAATAGSEASSPRALPAVAVATADRQLTATTWPPVADHQMATVADLADHRHPPLADIPTAKWLPRQTGAATPPHRHTPAAAATGVAAMDHDRQVRWFADQLAADVDMTAREWAAVTGLSQRTVERRLTKARSAVTPTERRSTSRQESTA